MKSNAPWSVKGIERDARETAKEAAKREGMTVGEWLNQLIYQAGDPEDSGGGEIEGLGLADLVKAIEHLNRRLIQTESKSIDAVNNLSRSVGSVVERLQRLERVRPEGGGASEEFEERLARLESGGGDRERIDALKALEKAVAQIALQFESTHKAMTTRLDANERHLQEFASRLDEMGGGGLSDAVEDLSSRLARIENIAGKASTFEGGEGGGFEAEFVDRTGKRMRVLGDEIKRCGDQIRGIEQGFHKLSEQIDGAERRSSEGVQKVSETIAELREQFSQLDTRPDDARGEIEAAVSAATQHADARIEKLQSTLDDMIARFSAEGGKGDLSVDLRTEEAKTSEQDAEQGAENGESKNKTAAVDEELEDFEADLAREDEDAAAEALDEDVDPFDLDADDGAGMEAGGDEDSVADESFDFDLDEEESEDRPPSPAQSVAKDILDEVRQAFSGGASKDHAPKDEDTVTPQEPPRAALEPEPENAPDDLDAVDAPPPPPAPEPPASDETGARKTAGASRAKTKALLLGQSEDSDSTPPEIEPEPTDKSNDYLKAARRAARETTGRGTPATRPAQGKLTARQKAIRAAQERHKRLTGSDESPPAERISSRSTPASPEPARSSRRDIRATAGRFGGAIATLRSKIPFLNKTDDADSAEEETTASPRFGAAKPPKQSSARPMTIALGAAIALAAAALFFLVKDIIFGPPPPTPTQKSVPKVEQPSSADTPNAEPSGLLSAERLDAPAAPTVKPDELYNESIAAFRAASDDTAVAKAIDGLEQAAALGHPPAQFQLAEFYKLGQGVPKDLTQARIWYQRAANGGNVLAMHRLGVMTARGEGGPADTEAAIGWFEKAANHGLVDAQYNLGTLYSQEDDGSGSSIRDAGKAYYWYSLAARGGDKQAGDLAASLAGALTPEKKQELDNAVEAWKAEPNDPEANTLSSPS